MLAMYLSAVKSSPKQQPYLSILGEENGVVSIITDQSILPGSRGAFLGSKRLSDATMHALSDQFGVEFAQVYTAGKGKNGGGGYYTLYSGTPNRVNLPMNSNEYLINHTHPGGTPKPSIYDIDYLRKKEMSNSKRRSSVILPSGGNAVRFDKNTPYVE